MSSIWLGSLAGLGLLILVGIAYGAHRMEMVKIENRRRASLHKDRCRDINFIIEVIPNGPLEGQLYSLLTRSMVMHLQKAVELDADNNDLVQQLERARGLHECVQKGEPLPKRVQFGSIGDELKDVKRGIKLLKEFILLQHKNGFLTKPIAGAYIKSLHEISLAATIDGLLRQAVHTQGEGSKSLALRYYQLALNEISKNKGGSKFAEQSKQIVKEIKKLKENQNAVNEATQKINQKLVDSISGKKDDDDFFEMKQMN
ncbi:MAG: hypothetical protein JKY88_17420 [Pseudomonadales bacterium]|nr:hypothetical protein [Pseudomonadales bacterium]